MINKIKIVNSSKHIIDLLAFIILLLFIHINMSVQLRDPDIWLHLKTGELISQSQSIPKTDPFSIALQGKEWIDHSWLVQVIFYKVFSLGGVDALLFLSSIAIVLAYSLLFFTFFRRQEDSTFIVAMLFLAALAPHMRFNIRPENFSVLFFSIFLFILTRFKETKLLFLLPLIQILWVNCHGFFVLGPFLLALFIFGELLKRSRILPLQWAGAGRFSDAAFKRLTVVFILCCLSSFFNPYGYKGVVYPLGIMFGSGGDLSIFYKYIQELMPIPVAHERLGMNVTMYYVFAGVSLFSFLINLKKINITHLITWAILFFLSIKINRNAMYFSFVAYTAATSNLLDKFDFNKVDLSKKLGKLIYLFNYIIVILIAIWLFKSGNDKLGKGYYSFEDYETKSIILGLNTQDYPVKAADFVLKNNLPGNIYNLFDYGHYLIYRLYPKYKVFIDGRTELYGKEFFENYLKTREANDQAIKSSTKKYNINTVILLGKDINDLAAYFYKSPDWKAVFFSNESLIFVKNSPLNQEIIKKLEVNLKDWQPPSAELEKIGLKNIFPEPYVKRAWLLYYFGLFESAMKEAQEALKIMPTTADVHCIIGLIDLKEKKTDQAYQHLRLAYIYGMNKKETLRGLGEYYMGENKYTDAIKVYKRMLKVSPSSEANYHLGLCYELTDQNKLAIDYFRKAIKLNPNSEKFYRSLGSLLYKTGDYKAAAKVYKDALKKKLNYRYFYRALSKLHQEKLSKLPSEK